MIKGFWVTCRTEKGDKSMFIRLNPCGIRFVVCPEIVSAPVSRARYRVRILSVVLITAAALMAGLSPGNAFARKWTDATGKHSIEADFVEFKDGKVRLRQADSSILVIPIEKLGEADQRFVREMAGSRSQAKKSESSPASAARCETKEGSCQVKQGGAFDKDVFTVHVGEKIKGTCKFSYRSSSRKRSSMPTSKS